MPLRQFHCRSQFPFCFQFSCQFHFRLLHCRCHIHVHFLICIRRHVRSRTFMCRPASNCLGSCALSGQRPTSTMVFGWTDWWCWSLFVRFRVQATHTLQCCANKLDRCALPRNAHARKHKPRHPSTLKCIKRSVWSHFLECSLVCVLFSSRTAHLCRTVTVVAPKWMWLAVISSRTRLSGLRGVRELLRRSMGWCQSRGSRHRGFGRLGSHWFPYSLWKKDQMSVSFILEALPRQVPHVRVDRFVSLSFLLCAVQDIAR